MFALKFKLGDIQNILSLAHAVSRGYRIRLGEDGCAEIRNPHGILYHIHNWACDCPDKLLRGGNYSGLCKHEIYLTQIHPCNWCRGVMLLSENTSCLGRKRKQFECPDCGNIRPFEKVLKDRRKAYGWQEKVA